MNAELDENGNPIVSLDDGEVDDDDIVYAESLCKPDKMLYMLELLLAFHAWDKRGHPFSLKTKKEKEEVMGAIRIMMDSIKKFAPRQDKNGWKLQKFHDMLHIVRDIENFGSPNNVDAAPNENNLIDFAKRPGKRAHKKREVFVAQVSKRLRETDLIRKAYNALTRTLQNNDSNTMDSEDMVVDYNDTENDEEGDEESDDIDSKLIGRPLFRVNFAPASEDDPIVECFAGKLVRTRRQLHPIVLDFLYNQCFKEDYPLQGQMIINLFTEYRRNGTTYRAHPNYNSFGEWYDWAMVKFEIDEETSDLSDDEQGGYYADNLFPAKVLCFMQAEDLSIYAVVHSCFVNTHAEDGILVERWKKEYEVINGKIVPLLRCVSVDTFEESCFVVEDKQQLLEDYGSNHNYIPNGVTLVKPREKAWPKEFL